MKNKFFFTILSALVALPMMAETIVYSPVSDWNLRPKGDGTGYDSSTPKEANATNTAFEVNHNARFCAVQQYEVANLGYATKMTLSLKGASDWGTDALAVWAVNGDWTSNMSAAEFNSLYAATTGLNPGVSGTTSATYLLRNKQNTKTTISGSTDRECTFVIDGAALTTLKSKAKNGVITLLITNNKETVEANSGSTKRQYYSNGNATEYLRPTLSVEVENIPAIYNQNSQAGYDNLATAVAAATAGDVLVLNEDVTISGARLEIEKALTIQGATGAEKIMCGVPANTLMILANDNTDNYDVIFKDLVVDGQNTLRSTQIFDANNKGRFVFENVSVVNSRYSVVTGDVKSNNREVVLKGNNSFATGIYLNSGKRISNDGTTHTTPIPVILAGDYANDYAIVLTCNDANLYTVKDADGVTGWELKVVRSGTKDELKGYVVSYDLHVSAAKMATLVLAYDAVLPAGVQAYTLTNDDSELIDAEEVYSITANEPVLVVAEENTYTFERGESEYNQAPTPASGGLVGSYKNATAIAQKTGDNYNYILSNGSAGVGFYQVLSDGYSIDKNHAYLSCNYNNAAHASAPMRIRFPQVPTQLDNAAVAAPAEKLLIDGKLYIRKADRTYTIDGQLMK